MFCFFFRKEANAAFWKAIFFIFCFTFTVAVALCRRRMSNEFEDLILNTKTGKLQLPGPRTRKLPFSPMITPRKANQASRPVAGATKEDISIRRVHKWSAQE